MQVYQGVYCKRILRKSIRRRRSNLQGACRLICGGVMTLLYFMKKGDAKSTLDGSNATS